MVGASPAWGRPILFVTDTETETLPHQEIDADSQTWGDRLPGFCLGGSDRCCE